VRAYRGTLLKVITQEAPLSCMKGKKVRRDFEIWAPLKTPKGVQGITDI